MTLQAKFYMQDITVREITKLISEQFNTLESPLKQTNENKQNT